MDLSKYIGETTTYDKKIKLEEKKPKSWLKSVSAFANGKGGALIFGVSDDERLVGLENYQYVSDKIREIVKSRVDPVPNIDLKIHAEEGKYFVVVHIESGNETPYYVIEGSSRTAYIRIGSESTPAASSNLKNLVLKGMKQSYDSMLTDISKEEASFTRLIAEYYSRTGIKFIDKDLYSFGLVSRDGFLTNAGALFADERLVYQSRVFCTRWNGLDKANGLMEALDDREFEGGLLYLLDNAISFVKANTKKMWKKGEKYRIEYPEYPERSVSEAIVNALIHREYITMGAEVHIDIYDNRLEIYSPGGMFDGTVVQNQDPYNISSTRRNPVISDLFSRMNLMERRGSGLRKIIEAYENEENYTEDLKPKFISTHSNFRVVLSNLNYNILMDEGQNEDRKNNINQELEQFFDDKNEDQNEYEKINISSRQELIILLLKDKPKITILEVSEKLKLSKSTIERELNYLKKNNLIEYEGSSKKGFWKVLY